MFGFYCNGEAGWAGANLEAKKHFGTFALGVATTEVRSGCDLGSGLSIHLKTCHY